MSKFKAVIYMQLVQKVISAFLYHNKLIFTKLAAEQSRVGCPQPRGLLWLVRPWVWVAAGEGGPEEQT